MIREKHLKRTKLGEIIGVPLGMILKTAVQVNSIEIDNDGQVIGNSIIVRQGGYSEHGIGRKVGICLGWSRKRA